MVKVFRALGRGLLRLLFALIVLTIVLVLVPFGRQAAPHPPGQLQFRRPMQTQAHGTLRAGAGWATIDLTPNVPLAGYPPPRRWDGVAKVLEVTALALEVQGLTQLYISLPALMVPPPLEEELLRRLALPPEVCVMVTATHTHSGPGGTWDNALLELGGNGAYTRERMESLVSAATLAAKRALTPMMAATLQTAQAPWPEGPATGRAGGAIDQTISAVRATRSDGTVVGTIVVYGMHPTVVPRSFTALSGDWPEVAQKDLESRTRAPALVLQGAVGDATWNRDGLNPEDT
ncbi:MAG: neutral/alkaline non-lysosomal ceramidase N-terminal domain-containing protein, partial [Deltaproteobacteria bacterium]|nr:neutral/alkaline non-lysosomal ceramidase N-terminal domain-containing protein [Deltaproteobacteria bacterium]